MAEGREEERKKRKKVKMKKEKRRRTTRGKKVKPRQICELQNCGVQRKADHNSAPKSNQTLARGVEDTLEESVELFEIHTGQENG